MPLPIPTEEDVSAIAAELRAQRTPEELAHTVATLERLVSLLQEAVRTCKGDPNLDVSDLELTLHVHDNVLSIARRAAG